MTIQDREGCLALLGGLYGKADEALLSGAIKEIETARIPATEGWAALVPYPVAQAWEKLSISGKFVAYAMAVDRESDLRE